MYDNRPVPPRTGRSAASPGPNGRALACVGLGWFSIGLGLAELAAPGNLAGLIGINQRRGLIRSPGVREISSGLGILSKTQPAAFLWSRVAGDAMDLALLAAALPASRSRSRVLTTACAVAGVAALDLLCSRRVSGRTSQFAEA